LLTLPGVVIPLVVAVLALATFVTVQARSAHPLLILASRNFGVLANGLISTIPLTCPGRVAAAMVAASPEIECPTMTADRPGDRSARPSRLRRR
jgi:hypothetical protein